MFEDGWKDEWEEDGWMDEWEEWMEGSMDEATQASLLHPSLSSLRIYKFSSSVFIVCI